MELNETERIAGSNLRLETFDDSSNGDNLTNDELQRENLVLRRQMEEMRSSLQSSNCLGWWSLMGYLNSQPLRLTSPSRWEEKASELLGPPLLNRLSCHMRRLP